jgi:voltage-gated potassium channel
MIENSSLIQMAQTFEQLDFEYGEQLLTALIPMGFTVFFHGLGMEAVRRYYKRFGQPVIKAPHLLRRSLVMISIAGIMLATHFSEIFLWALFYLAAGLIHGVKMAMFFSIETYSTLGASNIMLKGRWTGFEGFEAMTGMLMFGWSTAVFAAVVQKLHSIDD